MSYDFALQQVCPHTVLFENPVVDLNNGFVFFKVQPSNQSVVLHINGAVVPNDGLYSTANVKTINVGPYNIESNKSDLVIVKVGDDEQQILQLPSGHAVKTSDLVAFLNDRINNVVVSDDGGRITFTAIDKDVSFMFVDPRWTDRIGAHRNTQTVINTYKKLGIVPGKVVSGKKLFPGWKLVKDPSSPIETDKAIKFDDLLLNNNPTINVSYITTAQNCRRCGGIQIEYDYNVLDNTYEIVTDTDLLAQEFDKFVISTNIGSHWKWTWLGSGIQKRIGGKSITSDAMITLDINQAFSVYQNIKSQQKTKFDFQQVTDAEFPAELSSINSSYYGNDKTAVIVNVSVRSKSKVSVPLRRIVGTNNSFFLGGNSNPFTLKG